MESSPQSLLFNLIINIVIQWMVRGITNWISPCNQSIGFGLQFITPPTVSPSPSPTQTSVPLRLASNNWLSRNRIVDFDEEFTIELIYVILLFIFTCEFVTSSSLVQDLKDELLFSNYPNRIVNFLFILLVKDQKVWDTEEKENADRC